MWELILAAVFILLQIIVSIFVVVRAMRDTSKGKIINLPNVEIPKFSRDIVFEEYPDEVVIENKYDCNANTLRECRTDDVSTLYGCKELTVRCQHFDKDTEYKFEGTTKIIPKNKDPKQGYALAIAHIADACNAYHGDLVLVSLDVDTNEYMMVCQCKNPGYIGNEHLLGACNTPFICNGKVDNIDQPLEKINCKCQANETTQRYEDGTPVCKLMLVKEANEKFTNWAHLVPWSSDRLTTTDKFNPTVRDNLKTDKLLDPCRNSLNDPTVEIKGGSYNDILQTCQFRNNGFPLVTGLFPPTKLDLATVDAGLATDDYDEVRVFDNIAGKRRFNTIVTKLRATKDTEKLGTLAMTTADRIGFNDTSQLFLDQEDTNLITPECNGNWPTYYCQMQLQNSYMDKGIRFYKARDPPFGFWWSTEEWVKYEGFSTRTVTSEDKFGVSLNQQKMSEYQEIRPVGMVFPTASHRKLFTGPMTMYEPSDFEIHKNVIT